MEAKPTFNPEVPSIARTYDYLLGGKDNYPVDREIGEIFIKKFPGAVQIALDNRACLVRAVTFIAGELGISQFIDLGSGLPTADNVHQVAQRADSGAKVVYVDNDHCEPGCAHAPGRSGWLKRTREQQRSPRRQ